jgi:hypothetical protein
MLITLLLACGADIKGPLQSTLLTAQGMAPDRVTAGVWLQDADGRGVDDWDAGELTLSEAGEDVSPTWLSAQEMRVEAPIWVLVDVSQDGDLEAARGVLQAIADARMPDQPMGILSFADSMSVERSATTDGDAVQASIDDLVAQGPTTNLRGAVLAALGEWEDQSDATLALVRGTLVVVSDGGTGPDPTSQEDLDAVTLDRAIIGVDLGAGKAISSLATAGVAEDAAGAVELLERAQGSLIYATWCSDSRDGLVDFELNFKRGRLRGSAMGSVDAGALRDTVALESTTPLPEPIRDLNGVILGEWLVVGGGDADGSVYSAPIRLDGRLGSFRAGANIPSGENTRLHGVGDTVYAINGDQAWMASFEEGLVGSWSETESPGYANVMRSEGETLYSISRQRAYQVQAGGELSGWSTSADIPDGGLDQAVSGGVAGGNLYVVGSWRSGPDQAWQSRGWVADAQDPSSWTELALPGGYLGTWLGVADDGERLVIFPGSDADARTIWVGTPESGGQLAWTEGGTLAVERNAFSIAVDTIGRVYLHGGEVDGTLSEAGVVGQVSGESLALICE